MCAIDSPARPNFGSCSRRNQSRTGLLLDLDNLLISNGSCLGPPAAQALLLRILDLAGPVDYAIAAAPLRTIRQYGSTMALLGIRWEIVPTLPDAADYALLARADELTVRGYNKFVVASADHVFATLAGYSEVTVIVRRGQRVSRRLRSAASQVLAA